MSCAVDVAVVGGGPAGAAAAIWAALSGLRVRLLERRAFPRHRPGETLHPGIEPILRQLGINRRVEAATTMRHCGQWIGTDGRADFTAFGRDAAGAWRGYQILRERLDAILLDRAREVGVDVVQPDAAVTPIVEDSRVVGVRARHETRARFVVDAGGGRGWLRRHLRLPVATASPPLRATYGYCEGDVVDAHTLPSFIADRNGWTWIAEVAPRRFNWTRLAFVADDRDSAPPPRLASLRPIGRVRGADVTWRCLPAAAGRGYFVAGDAACVLDPASAHGVLRALMSGMMAAHTVHRVKDEAIEEEAAAAGYCAWTGDRFRAEVKILSAFYQELAPSTRWLREPSPPDLNGRRRAG